MGSAKQPRLHKRTAATKGFTPEQIAALTAANEGNKSRTPQVLVDAFFPKAIKVGDLKLRALSLAEFILLEKIESPLLEIDQVDESEVSLENFAAAVFILAMPFDVVEPLICEGGKAEFDRAVRQFATKVPGGETIALGRKVQVAIAEAFATVQQVSGEKKTARTPASAGG